MPKTYPPEHIANNLRCACRVCRAERTAKALGRTIDWDGPPGFLTTTSGGETTYTSNYGHVGTHETRHDSSPDSPSDSGGDGGGGGSSGAE